MAERKTAVCREQPVHDPDQIRNPGQLEVGEFYRRYRVISERDTSERKVVAGNLFEVISEPEKREVEISEEHGSLIGGIHHKVHLYDLGLAPFDGLWNPVNYVMLDERPDYW